MSQRSLEMVRALQHERGSNITFDSGGYYVQTGRFTYQELYLNLLNCYRANLWADRYVLPDHVPTSRNNSDEVHSKVRETVQYARLFCQELPAALRQRVMPVVHGHTFEQVDHCLAEYLKLDTEWIGFGSFGTGGKDSETNIATQSSVGLARHVSNVAAQQGRKVHLFGLGVPALVPLLDGVGAASFDSSSWLKSAGFGQVHLPFTRSYNITYSNGGAHAQRGIVWSEFEMLKALTGHACIYCHDRDTLAAHKMHRAAHNLAAIAETVSMINNREYDKIGRIYRNASAKYRKEYETWPRRSH
ncbi:MAG: hypothetical protein ABI670_11260 [Chloroflexota bacterium]